MRRSRSGGFTLIELLVVIAIIAILAAILFPVFSRVREQAKYAGCTALMKEFGAGLQMYLDDYNNRPPLHTSWWKLSEMDPRLPAKYVGYYDLLRKYFRKRYGAFVCPGDPTGCIASALWRRAGLGGQPPDTQDPVDSTKVATTTGYGTWINPWGTEYWSVSQVVDVKRCPYLWDATFDFVDGGITDRQLQVGFGHTTGGYYDDKARVAARHSGAVNVLYFDGHVKLVNYIDPVTKVKRLPIYDCPWHKGCLPD